jgi:RES domain-containing protein
MIVYRLADKRYIEDREGIGAKLFGGRWNDVNLPCIYASEHVSLAFLEKFVHARAKEDMLNIGVLEIDIPDDEELVIHVDANKLDSNWRENISYTQWIGEQMLDDVSIVAFSVPSVLVPTERNYVLNTRSLRFKEVKYKRINDFNVDYRLLSSLL